MNKCFRRIHIWVYQKSAMKTLFVFSQKWTGFTMSCDEFFSSNDTLWLDGADTMLFSSFFFNKESKKKYINRTTILYTNKPKQTKTDLCPARFAPHIIQWKHLQIAVALCRNFGNIDFYWFYMKSQLVRLQKRKYELQPPLFVCLRRAVVHRLTCTSPTTLSAPRRDKLRPGIKLTAIWWDVWTT